MKEAFIKNIINDLCKVYEYGVIDINSDFGLATNWGGVKNLNNNSKRVIIFINNSGISEEDKILLNLKHNLNIENIELVKILLFDKSDLYSIDNDTIRKSCETNGIAVNYMDNKILAYGYEVENAAREVASILNYREYKNEEEKKNKFKPWITYGIIGINILMYIISSFLSNNFIDSDINVLIFLGAKYNRLINEGQYYRLITCMFLHGGLMHVALNMYSLYSIGPLVEKIYGKTKYLIIYFISGITASIVSYLFSQGVSIGASGAIFGLLGTTLIFAIKMRKNIGRDFLRSILSVVVINLFIGFTMPNIDSFAHLGGLAGGIIVPLLFNLHHKKTKE